VLIIGTKCILCVLVAKARPSISWGAASSRAAAKTAMSAIIFCMFRMHTGGRPAGLAIMRGESTASVRERVEWGNKTPPWRNTTVGSPRPRGGGGGLAPALFCGRCTRACRRLRLLLTTTRRRHVRWIWRRMAAAAMMVGPVRDIQSTHMIGRDVANLSCQKHVRGGRMFVDADG
jgi:hypothetical protein